MLLASFWIPGLAFLSSPFASEDIHEMWLKGRTRSEKGVAQINDSFTTEMDFFKTSFSFWKVGNWFSCLLKHHDNASSCRTKLWLWGFTRTGKKVIPPRGRSHSSHLSSFPGCWRCRSSLTTVQQRCDSWSADRTGSDLMLHWQTGKSGTRLNILRKEIKKHFVADGLCHKVRKPDYTW